MFYRSRPRFATRYDYTFRQHEAMFLEPIRRIELVPPPRSGAAPTKESPGAAGAVGTVRKGKRQFLGTFS